MNILNSRTTRVVAAAAAVPALLVGAACSDETSTETVTSVLDAGDGEDQITLPPAPRVGQSASGPMSMDMNIAVSSGGQDIEVDLQFSGDLTTEVVEVGEGGGYTLRTTFHDVEVESSEPQIVSEMERAIPDGLAYEETYDEMGERVSSDIVDAGLSEAERAAVEEFV